MKTFDKDKFIKNMIIAITMFVVVGVVVITTLIMTNILTYKIGNFINLCLILVVSWLNFYIQLLSNQKKFKFVVTFMLVFSIIVTIAVITSTILLFV